MSEKSSRRVLTAVPYGCIAIYMTNTETTGTCQVCGRTLKLRNGLIAHHGHRVIGGGMRLSQRGCYGGKRRPLEESTAALTEEVGRVRALLEANPRGVGSYGMRHALAQMERRLAAATEAA